MEGVPEVFLSRTEQKESSPYSEDDLMKKIGRLGQGPGFSADFDGGIRPIMFPRGEAPHEFKRSLRRVFQKDEFAPFQSSKNRRFQVKRIFLKKTKSSTSRKFPHSVPGNRAFLVYAVSLERIPALLSIRLMTCNSKNKQKKFQKKLEKKKYFSIL